MYHTYRAKYMIQYRVDKLQFKPSFRQRIQTYQFWVHPSWKYGLWVKAQRNRNVRSKIQKENKVKYSLHSGVSRFVYIWRFWLLNSLRCSYFGSIKPVSRRLALQNTVPYEYIRVIQCNSGSRHTDIVTQVWLHAFLILSHKVDWNNLLQIMNVHF